MSDLLEPGEVDALLAAVASGNVTVPRGQTAGTPGTVTPYDFTRPERVGKDQLHALTALHERFARNLSVALAALTRTTVEVKVSSVQQLNCSEFIAALADPTALAVLSASTIPGSFILEMAPTVAFPVIDRMLGGSQQQVAVPDRPLTDIEQRLFRRFVGQVLPLLEETWTNIRQMTFSIAEISTNPQLVQVVPPHEAVVVVRFDVVLDANYGSMSLCLPYSSIEPVMAQLTTQNWFSTARREFDDSQVIRLTKALSAATLEMVADLAETTITVRELLDLQVGDVIKTNLSVDGEITLSMEGKAKFKGHPGRVRRSKAVQISRRLDPNPRD